MALISRVNHFVHRIRHGSYYVAAPQFSNRKMLLLSILSVFVWSAFAILLGMLVGLGAVILPPVGLFGFVGVFAIILLWAAPDLQISYGKLVWKLLIVATVIGICIPAYYAVQPQGAPWISIRRLVIFPLIIGFGIAIGTSPLQRKRVLGVLSANRLASVNIVGFIAFSFLSLFTAQFFSGSVGQFVDAAMNWFIPLFIMMCVIEGIADALFYLEIVGWCSVFVNFVGAMDFTFNHRFYLDLIPAPILSNMMATNPAFAAVVQSSPFRNGIYRASSLYTVPLSLGEFASMMIPIAFIFINENKILRHKVLGYFMIIFALFAIFASGSRGGYLSGIVSLLLFSAAWMYRSIRFRPQSLGPAILAVAGTTVFSVFVVLTLTWPRLHNVIIGGGNEIASAEARVAQWNTAWPKILANPVTGHGFGQGAGVVGYFSPGAEVPTLDSYVISLLVETGVPGFVFFFGMIIFASITGFRYYFTDGTRLGAVCGSLACALVAFGVNRTVLSQRENHFLFFVALAVVLCLANAAQREKKSAKELPMRVDPDWRG